MWSYLTEEQAKELMDLVKDYGLCVRRHEHAKYTVSESRSNQVPELRVEVERAKSRVEGYLKALTK